LANRSLAKDQNELFTLNVGGDTITGSQVFAAKALFDPSITNGNFNVVLSITGLTRSRRPKFTDLDADNPAFEFIPGVPVPEPGWGGEQRVQPRSVVLAPGPTILGQMSHVFECRVDCRCPSVGGRLDLGLQQSP